MEVESYESEPGVPSTDMDDEPTMFERKNCSVRRPSKVRRGSKYVQGKLVGSEASRLPDSTHQELPFENRNLTVDDLIGRIVFENEDDEIFDNTSNPFHQDKDVKVNTEYINEPNGVIDVDEDFDVAETFGHLDDHSSEWDDDWFSVSEMPDVDISIPDHSTSIQELADELGLDPNSELLRHIEIFLRENPGMLELLELLQSAQELRVVEEPKIVGNCDICFAGDVVLRPTACCKFPTCVTCMEEYLKTKISEGVIRIGCPNFSCNQLLHRDEIRRHLDNEMKAKYDRFLVDANKDPHRKTCPRCSHITQIQLETLSERGVKKHGLQVSCSECQLEWCFPCQAPWHQELTCKQFQAGDKLLHKWAKDRPLGEANAQKCPKCKVFIQRSEGCDHMECSRCNTKFCYRCGERRLKMKFKPLGIVLEDHDKKYSILGCKHIYKDKKDVRRALTRGAIFGGKVAGGVILGPVAVGLVAGAAGLAVGVGVIALPIYGLYKLARFIRKQKQTQEA